MTTRLEDNVAAVRRAFAAYNVDDLDGYGALYGARITVRSLCAGSAREHTNEQARAGTERFRETFPDHRCEIDTIVAQDDLVTVHYLSSATHAPTSKAVTWACSSVYRFRNGVVVEVLILNDTHRLREEIGATASRRAGWGPATTALGDAAVTLRGPMRPTSVRVASIPGDGDQDTAAAHVRPQVSSRRAPRTAPAGRAAAR